MAMLFALKKYLFAVMAALLLAGCGGLNNARVRIDYERFHKEVTVAIDGESSVKFVQGNDDVLVKMPKGKHHLVVMENEKTVIDTVVTVKNVFGASAWLSWNLGGFLFCVSMLASENIFLSSLLFFIPPLVISEDDLVIPVGFNLDEEEMLTKFKVSGDGSPVRYFGEEGVKMQISGESSFVNGYENGMAVSTIKDFCFLSKSKSVLLKSDDGKHVNSVDIAKVRVCTGTKTEMSCNQRDADFWKDFPCNE